MDIDELKSRLGTSEPAVYDIEKGMVRSFVRAIDDPNPRWQAMAPPTLLLTIGLERIQQQLLDALPTATILHGSTELECYLPVKPGDTLEVAVAVVNIRERQGQMGKTAFISFDTEYTNQKRELVARCRQLVITY